MLGKRTLSMWQPALFSASAVPKLIGCQAAVRTASIAMQAFTELFCHTSIIAILHEFTEPEDISAQFSIYRLTKLRTT